MSDEDVDTLEAYIRQVTNATLETNADHLDERARDTLAAFISNISPAAVYIKTHPNCT
jgi:hypothetical protein